MVQGEGCGLGAHPTTADDVRLWQRQALAGVMVGDGEGELVGGERDGDGEEGEEGKEGQGEAGAGEQGQDEEAGALWGREAAEQAHAAYLLRTRREIAWVEADAARLRERRALLSVNTAQT